MSEKMKNIKWLAGGILLGMLTATPSFAEPGIFDFLKKKKKNAKQEQAEKKAEPKKSPYERILTDKPIETASSKLLKLHKTDGKLYLELSKKNLGRDMLLGLSVSASSDPALTTVGFVQSGPVHIRFVQRDSSVVMDVVNTGFLTPGEEGNKTLARSVEQNYSSLSLRSFPIKGYSKDSTSLLVDVSPFFLEESQYFTTAPSGGGSLQVNARELKDLANVKQIKAFDTNATIKVNRSFSLNVTVAGQKLKSNEPVTFEVSYTLLDLPDKPMTPRLADARVGIFLTRKTALHEGSITPTYLARRWRVEPADPIAYQAGKLSLPKKHIVYYLDPAFPASWREAIKEGVLRWNAPFERIGFKDVIQVKDYPTNDPHFDPDNLEYSCIRFVPQDTENAMGPSWSDPRSGEIINGSVFVYRDISTVINRWRFVQTAQLDPAVRTRVMPEEVFGESMKYVMAHEIGHTLGFMHNMGASSAYHVDSLRSVSFTKEFGTTPSIMDYARHNYVAQREDKGVALDPPAIGVYDAYLVDWAYRAYPDLKGDYVAEKKRLDAFVDKHAGNPLYRYGRQQSRVIDPSSLSEDLSNDPIKASNYGMRNLRYVIENIDTWIQDDPSSKHKSALYQETLIQGLRYISNVYSNVGGIYLYHTSEASGLPRYQVVPRAYQRQATLWLLEQAKTFHSFADEALEDKLYYAENRPWKLYRRGVQLQAILATHKLARSYYLDSTSYAPLEYCQDVYEGVFAKTLKGEESLTEAERSLQELYISYLLSAAAPIAEGKGGGKKSLQSIVDSPWMQELEALQTKVSGARHLCSLTHQKDVLQGDTLGQWGWLDFGSGYGAPEEMWDASINRTENYLYSYALKVQALLKQVVQSTKDEELQAFYAYQLSRFNPLDK